MKSILSRVLSFGAVAAFTLCAWSGNAHADAMNPDACLEAQVGNACSNAGTNGDEPGTCLAETCPHYNPADGGEYTYACYVCEPSDGGSTTTDGGSGATTVRDDAGSTSTAAPTSSSSCSASPGARDGATGFAMLALGILGLAIGRRKRA